MTWIQQIFGQSVPTSHVTSIFLGGYILGCLTTGYYLVRFRLGLDIRTMESGSVGARNVGRVLGTPGFFITLLGDFAKGLLAAGMTRYFTHDDRLTGLAMLAVVMGHIWPLQLGLRGGKGVATSLGALAVYDFYLSLAFVALFAGLFFVFRRTTLAGLTAFAFLPLAAVFMDAGLSRSIVMSILAGMILIAHWRNLLGEFSVLAMHRHGQPKTGPSIK